MHDFAQVDVFGSDDGFGNPVAVVLGADGVPETEMRRIANWTNLSETTFVMAPTRTEADYRVRIFTPHQELPFAGHPTLGSAHAWCEATGCAGERLTQECDAGLIALRRDGERIALAAPPLTRSGPVDDETLAEVVAALGIDADEVVEHAFTDNGPGWVTVRLRDAERVLALRLPAESAHEIGVVGLHPDGTPELRAFPVFGESVTEDPVTGSLNAGVATWLLGSGVLSAPYVARQGTALGRAGRVHVDQDADGTIWVAGRTDTLVSGSIAI